ncbi:MAG: hypothetical protein HZA54_10255 [Planctomycetes bacterium]|nr:hypothetical protein [Planctomycetota bacterium]
MSKGCITALVVCLVLAGGAYVAWDRVMASRYQTGVKGKAPLRETPGEKGEKGAVAVGGADTPSPQPSPAAAGEGDGAGTAAPGPAGEGDDVGTEAPEPAGDGAGMVALGSTPAPKVEPAADADAAAGAAAAVAHSVPAAANGESATGALGRPAAPVLPGAAAVVPLRGGSFASASDKRTGVVPRAKTLESTGAAGAPAIRKDPVALPFKLNGLFISWGERKAFVVVDGGVYQEDDMVREGWRIYEILDDQVELRKGQETGILRTRDMVHLEAGGGEKKPPAAGPGGAGGRGEPVPAGGTAGPPPASGAPRNP